MWWADAVAIMSTRPGALGQAVYVELYRRIEKVNDRLLEGEEPIVHLMG